MDSSQEIESFYYIKFAIRLIKQYWYIFTFSVLVCVGGAFFVNWYLPPNYLVSSTVLLEETKEGKPDPSQEFNDLFSIFTPISNIQMEILKMKSSDLVNKALRETNSEFTIYVKNGIKTKELYDDSPFKIEGWESEMQPVAVQFDIIPQKDNKFRLVVEQGSDLVQLYNYKTNKHSFTPPFSLNEEFVYGAPIKSDYLCFKISVDEKKLAKYPADSKFHFSFNNLDALTYIYKKALNIEQVAKDVSAVTIKLKVENPQKGIDFINALTKSYFNKSMEKKNFVADNTIQYFDDQLGVLEDSLKITENKLQNFRSTNKVMEIGAKSDILFKEAQELETQKAELQARGKYYDYMNENLNKDTDGSNILPPSSMGVNDNVLTGLIQEYIQLNSEKNNLVQNNLTKSPHYNSLLVKIRNQKNILSENVTYLINTNNLLLASLENRLKKSNAQIGILPSTERQLVGIERKYKLNDNIYNYILKKKAEAQVAKASTLTDSDILEPAQLAQLKPVSPSKILNLSIAFVVGLVLPFGIFGIKNLMDNKIENEQMVHVLTKYPSLGRIVHKKNKQSSLLANDAKSPISESIRSIRANIDHFLKGERNQVILITSSVSGEGKSFTSLNLAASFALLGRKTVLVDFDLRKPNLFKLLNVENKLGISSILGGTSTLEDTLISTEIPNLDFISAGTNPSNPTELIGSEKTEALINKLKEKYDYVIVDTPPIGLVTEAFIIMKYVNMKILIVRENYTSKKQLANLFQDIEEKDIESVFWLLNDVNIQNTIYGEKSDYFN
jgi:tyrosine-protein kinase Etk/Wzc